MVRMQIKSACGLWMSKSDVNLSNINEGPSFSRKIHVMRPLNSNTAEAVLP